jgi:hypothetical protein
VTADEQQRIHSFLARFNRIDARLRRKLGLSRTDGGFNQVLNRLVQTHPNLVDADSLRTLAAIRNALVHETLGQSDFCVVPTRTAIQQLDSVIDKLVAPLRVIPSFRRKVETITPEDTLHSVLQLIARRDYSQFPVCQHQRFLGLLIHDRREVLYRALPSATRVRAGLPALRGSIATRTVAPRIAATRRNMLSECPS